MILLWVLLSRVLELLLLCQSASNTLRQVLWPLFHLCCCRDIVRWRIFLDLTLSSAGSLSDSTLLTALLAQIKTYISTTAIDPIGLVSHVHNFATWKCAVFRFKAVKNGFLCFVLLYYHSIFNCATPIPIRYKLILGLVRVPHVGHTACHK